MPLGDQTGPRGKGPLTGRGAGVNKYVPMKPRDDGSFSGGGAGNGYGASHSQQYYRNPDECPEPGQRMATLKEARIDDTITWADIFHYV